MILNVDNVDECKGCSTLSSDKQSEISLIMWTSLHAKEEPNALAINSLCYNHMIHDRIKFNNLKKWNNRSVKFGGKYLAEIYGRWTIITDEKDKTKDVLMSVKCVAKDIGEGAPLGPSMPTRGNIYIFIYFVLCCLMFVR